MTDTTFPTGFSRLTSVSTSFTVYADNGTTGGYITVGDIIGLVSSYSLPTASTSTLGGVKVDGTSITISAGVISASYSYTLPTASTSVLGGVKVDGSTITISGGGVISAAGSYTLPAATTSVRGGVRPDGTTITISGDVISAVGGGGGGSGTVNSGTLNQLAYYAGAGTAVSGLTLSTSFSIATGTISLVQATTSILGGVTFSATNPAAPGSAAPGSATSAARSDHVHPLPPNVSSGAAGLAPASGGGTTNFLRADGSWAAPGGGGSSTTPVTTVATSGATQTVSFPASGNAAYDVTLSANCTFTVTGGTAAQMQTVSVQLRAGTGGFTTTWPAGVVWKGGSPPSAALTSGQVLLVQLRTLDAGTTIIGDF